MAPSTVHLPNGQTLTVSPVFGGLLFRADDLKTSNSVFPPGWTIVLNSEDEPEEDASQEQEDGQSYLQPHSMSQHQSSIPQKTRPRHIHRFKKPTLRNDHLFISSISNPSSTEFKPATSPTRQIAMMLWATLWWYFHQPEPAPQLHTSQSKLTPDEGKPKGDWRVNINHEGIFKGKHALPKLERMGLIASEESSVGTDPDERSDEGWTKMFVSRRTFWQLDPRIYLFTLTPNVSSPFPAGSPSHSRPSSPSRMLTPGKPDEALGTPAVASLNISNLSSTGAHLWRSSTPPGPFSSGSHLPTFYPPPPTQYTYTNNVRHPIRPKPPRQGETFYTRYIPSLGEYLSFRVASLSKHPVMHHGPFSTKDHTATTTEENQNLSDAELLHKWMNNPRVSHSWGETGPLAHQEAFLRTNLASRHSFPVIASFDNHPFAYFELYYLREDRLASHLSPHAVGDWDRGVHVLVGEQAFRGPHRVKVWLSALVHYCWLADARTESVVMEPRVDNAKLRAYCESVGFWKEREVAFQHKQSNFMRARREGWEAPVL